MDLCVQHVDGSFHVSQCIKAGSGCVTLSPAELCAYEWL